jgi:uncharacterized protein
MSLAHLRVLYLHGFASSPASRKAIFFSEKLEELGISVEVPDLAEQNFRSLTITGQLRAIERTAGGEAISLIGSSMGGYLASLYASRHPEVQKLVLLAPAFRFHDLWVERLGPEKIGEWKESGALPFFHYGEQRELALGFQLLQDAADYEQMPDFTQPALIFHGTQDTVVPSKLSSGYAATHPNVKMTLLPSGHELTDVLDTIWEDVKGFFS